MGAHRRTDRELILGRLVCDRLGLNPHTTSAELEVENMGNGTIWIKSTNLHTMSAGEWADLQALAAAKAAAGE